MNNFISSKIQNALTTMSGSTGSVENNIPDRPTLKEQGYVPARYMITLLSFFGFLINFQLRDSLNLAIVAMSTSNRHGALVNEEGTCHFPGEDNKVPDYNGQFEWDEWTQNLVLGSFYWAYVAGQMPSGWLADKIGTRLIFGVGMVLTGLLSLLMPVAANLHFGALIAVRILMGFCLSPTYTSIQALLARWAPPTERSVIASVIFTGRPAGTVIGYPLTAALIDSIGWESVFYVQGILTLVWCIVWFLVISDDPNDFEWITEKEKIYIVESIGESVNKNKESLSVPWKKILKSASIWALIVTSFGDNWGFFTLLTDLPLYMKSMMKLDIHSNALLSAMPYIGMWISSIIICLIADSLIHKRIFTTTTVRKAVNTITQAGPAICLFCLPLVECNRTGTIALLFVAVTLNGGTGAGYEVNVLDLAPKYAGTIYGFVNSIGNLPALFAPMTIGALTNHNQTNKQWQIVFFIAGCIYLIGCTIYLIFGSGEEQPWNNEIDKEESDASVK